MKRITKSVIKYRDLIAVLVILFLVILFFAKLFVGGTKVFVTPDFQTSDLWHYTFAEKYFLSNSLHKGIIPEYTQLILGGSSLLADGQIGYLNIINIILFGLLRPEIAFNLGYVLYFFLAGSGCYFLARRFKLQASSSLLAAVSFTFSGMMILKISHYTLLQNISLIPWILLFFDLMISSKMLRSKIIFMLIVVLLWSQQFLLGQFQYAFISAFGLFVYLCAVIVTKYRTIKRIDIALFILIFFISLFAISPQIIATGELYVSSIRNSRINQYNSLYPSFSFKSLLTFFNPYLFGSPQDGSYWKNVRSDTFWESNMYISAVGGILFLYGLFATKKSKLFKVLLILIVVSTLLMLGTNTPFYIILLLPPFSLFRAPSRFNAITILCIALSIGYVWSELSIKIKNLFFSKIIYICILIIIISDLFYHFYRYQPIQSYMDWIKPSETAIFLSKKPDASHISFGGNYLWFNYFKSNGWKNIDTYKFFQNSVEPKLNLIYNLPSIDTFVSSFFISKRDFIILETILFDLNGLEKDTVELSSKTINLLRLLGTEFIVSPYKLTVKRPFRIQSVFQTRSPQLQSVFTVYYIPDSFKKYHFAKTIHTYDTIYSLMVYLNSSFSTVSDYVTQDEFKKYPNLGTLKGEGEVLSFSSADTTQHLKVKVTSDQELLIINTALSPHWKGFVDGKNTTILEVNGKYQGVIVPKGLHTVTLKYRFELLEYSYIVMIGMNLLIILTIVVLSASISGKVYSNTEL